MSIQLLHLSHLSGKCLHPSCSAYSLLEPGGMFLKQNSPRNLTDMLGAHQKHINRILSKQQSCFLLMQRLVVSAFSLICYWLELLAGMAGFILTWLLLEELCYAPYSTPEMLALGTELTLAARCELRAFWSNLRCFGSIGVSVWNNGGPGSTILSQSSEKFLISEWKILCYSLWFHCVLWYFFWKLFLTYMLISVNHRFLFL